MKLPDDTETLAHFGTKGMKWGVRNDKGHEGERARNKTIQKVDAAYANNSTHAWVLTNNRAAELTNPKLDALNAKPRYKNHKGPLLDNYGNGVGPVGKQYVNEYHQMYLNNLKKAAKELGTNASGTKEYTISRDPKDKYSWGVMLTDVKHTDMFIGKFKVIVDENGRLAEIVPLEDAMSSDIMMSSTDVYVYQDSFLEHAGKKGMHWGVRNAKKPTAGQRLARSKFGKAAQKNVDSYNRGSRRDRVIRGTVMTTSLLALSGIMTVSAISGKRSVENYDPTPWVKK